MKKLFMNSGFYRSLMVLLLLVTGMGQVLVAQDVTVSPTTGTILAALTGGSEGGSQRGWGSTWRHKQLPLTFTIGDFGVLTAGGELRYPAGNMILNDGKNHTAQGGYNMTQTLYTSRIFDTTNGNYVVMGGYCSDIFMAFSLPKGYRFTGYEIVVANNMIGASNFGGWEDFRAQNKILYETKDLTHIAAVNDAVAAQYSYADLYKHCDDVSLYTQITDAIDDSDDNYLALAKKRTYDATTNTYTMSNEYVMGTSNDPANVDYVISRSSMSDDDMGNHLYFRVSHDEQYREGYEGNDDYTTWVGLTIKSIKIYFSAEGDFTETVTATPTTIFDGGKNYVNSPFETGKVDLGNVSQDANGHYTYKVLNQKDLAAYNTLFQEDAVSGGALPATPGNGGITAEINGGNYYYGLKNNTYYVECPTSVKTTSGEESPVGFRIIGASVNYNFGSTTGNNTQAITREYDQLTLSYVNNNTKYYMGNDYGRHTSATNWFMDDEGYVRCGTNGSNYLTIDSYTRWGTTYTYFTTTATKSEALKFKKNGAYLQVAEGEYEDFYVCYGAQYYDTFYWRPRSVTSQSPNPQNPVVIEGTGSPISISVGSTTLPAFTPTPYTLTVYDKDGTTVKETVSVNSSNASGSITLSNLNNDAIKFAISGLEGTNARALITVDLTMQALDPYIDQMSVVCSDPQTVPKLRITQTFTASDFSVSGGSFHFSLPAQCKTHEVKITFEDLYSPYGDESYPNGHVVNFSRYNFVKSEHYNFFGASNNNIYNSYSEAASPTKERLKVGIVGNKAFKFNNAADVAAGSAQYYIEYPFSLENYANTPNNGSFEDMKFTVSEDTDHDTGYVFTTDETAYNISPVTTTQHRSYAFYTMNISVASATYTPEVEFVPVYSKTLNGNEEETAYYGAKVTAIDDDHKPGYSSTDIIFQLIDGAIKATETSGSVTVKDENNEDIEIGTYTGKATDLKSAKQLLYLDFSQLAGIFQVTTGQQGSMDDYSNTNAANCLIFLPVGASAPNNNVAAKISATSNTFRAAHDIILTDKEPFFSPYDITINDANKAYYKRLITLEKYGQAKNASIIMPFAITVDEYGKHTNADEKDKYFTVHKMQDEKSLSVLDNKLTAYFPAIENVKVTEANMPYLVNIPKDYIPEDKTYSFIVSQKGTTIKATTGMNSDYTFTGDKASGTVDENADVDNAGATYNFTSMGTYAGLHVAKEQDIFYFAKDMLFSSLDLNRANVSIYPFRMYYKTKDPSKKSPNSLQVFIGKNENENDTEDAIRDLREKEMDMSIRTGRGTLTITSTTDNQIRINSISGVSHYNLNIGAGETKTVSVPAGIYVVNGVNILVK